MTFKAEMLMMGYADTGV